MSEARSKAAREKITENARHSSENNVLGSSVNQSGEIIDDKYEIIARIGSGGLGTVFKARHLLAEKTVAIKVLNPGKEFDQRTIARFKLEAETAMDLKHQNIGSVQDIGMSEGLPYLVMEFVEGKPLNQVIEEDSLTEEEKVSILKEICEALDYAREKNVVHRDIKPQNVIITPDKTAKVIDFGIAKVVDERERLTLTNTSDFFGSPKYMSPEQCLGEETEHRSDIYSLGCLAFTLFSSEAPYERESILAILNAHISDEIPKLSPIKDFKGLENVIVKAMAKNKKHRHASAEEMLEEIKKVEQGIEPRYAPVPVRKKRIAFIFWGSIVSSIVVLLGLLWFVKTFSTATIESRTEELQKNPNNVDALIDRGRLFTTKGEYLFALSDLKKAVQLEPRNAFAHIRKGICENALGNYDIAIKEMNRGIELAPNNYRGYLDRGRVYQNQKKLNLAIKDYEKAIKLNSWNHANNNSVAYTNLSGIFVDLKEYEKCIDAATRAISLNKSMPQPYQNRALAYFEPERYSLNLKKSISDSINGIKSDTIPQGKIKPSN